jgi:hypothetical protein
MLRTEGIIQGLGNSKGRIEKTPRTIHLNGIEGHIKLTRQGGDAGEWSLVHVGSYSTGEFWGPIPGFGSFQSLCMALSIACDSSRASISLHFDVFECTPSQGFEGVAVGPISLPRLVSINIC